MSSIESGGGVWGRKEKKISTVTAATNPAGATLHGSVGPPLMEVNKTSAPKISIKTKGGERRDVKDRVKEKKKKEGKKWPL